MTTRFQADGMFCSVFGVLLTVSVSGAVGIDTVVVGNPGNPNDEDFGFGEPLGGVAYTYRIGTFEVTNLEYAEFLNAVASDDTHGLYNVDMTTDARGGILRDPNNTTSFTTKPNMADKPVNFVSYWDATRFANWLHNGQPSGVQDEATTEDGAYTLGRVTNPVSEDVKRNAGARWFLPSENEWYKAAYHQPAAEGGDENGYWSHATRSNRAPRAAVANEIGEISNGTGRRVANYLKGADWNGLDGNVTSVGSGGVRSTSYYGTFDQAGNVDEWNENILIADDGSSSRGIRGGSWATPAPGNLTAAFANVTLPEFEASVFGFRVATVPEPTSTASFGWLAVYALFRSRSNRRSRV